VRVDGSISNGAYEIVACGKRNVDPAGGVPKVLGQSKVDEVYGIVNSNHEVLWLNVAMYVAMIMKSFQRL
jgi:hypothetical protein